MQRAVIEGQQVTLGYRAPRRRGHQPGRPPLGLAAKGSAWYLVAATDAGLRTFRVDRMSSVEPTGEAVVRPEGFDLAEAWRLIADEVDRRRRPWWPTASCGPTWCGCCGRFSATGSASDRPAPTAGSRWSCGATSIESLAAEVAGLGAMLELLDPPEVRERLAAIADQLAALYGARLP